MKYNFALRYLTMATASDLRLSLKVGWEALRQMPGHAEEPYASLPRRIQNAIRLNSRRLQQLLNV